MKHAFTLLVVLSIVSLGCGSDEEVPKDAAIDSTTDDARCGGEAFFTGEILDWNSTASSFCGVPFATLAVRGDSSRTDATAPNGRFELCLAPAVVTEIDLIPPSSMSPCAPMPGTYMTPGILVANKAVIDRSQFFSARMFTVGTLGFALEPTKAHVFVHVAGSPRKPTITASHDPSWAFDGATWALGDTGESVFFPNVSVGGGATDVQVPAPSIGGGSVPLAAGTVTYVMLIAQ